MKLNRARVMKSDWITSVLPSSTKYSRVSVYHPTTDIDWPEVAESYLNNQLSARKVVSSSKSTQVEEVSGLYLRNSYFFKKYFHRGTWDRVKSCVRASRAMRAFIAAQKLREQGFNVAEVCCLIECYRFGFPSTSVLVAIAVEPAITLRKWFSEKMWYQQGGTFLKCKVIGLLAREVGRMHRMGIYHGDMNLGNILLPCSKSGDFVWLDTERVNFYSRLPEKKRKQNLRQLTKIDVGLSDADYQSFLNDYLEVAGLRSNQLMLDFGPVHSSSS